MVPAVRDTGRRRNSMLLMGVFLVLMLGTLLTLQARWLGELATAQREGIRRVLQAAAQSMVTEFETALAGVQQAVRADPEGAAELDLVAEVYALESDEEPVIDVPAFVVHGPGDQRWLVVLEREHLERELFPALVERVLSEEGLEAYRVAVVPVGGGVPLYSSHAAPPGAEVVPDASADLRLRPNRWIDILGEGGGSWTSADAPVFVAQGDSAPLALLEEPASWRLEIRHRAGSLEVALGQVRTRNFGLGAGLLALLVAGLAFFWVAEQRARRLAEKELAFVAGVSHELRTPLTVVRTAASNLARGVVNGDSQVAEYGSLIEREATRVSVLVERVLRFGADGAPLVLGEVAVSEVLEEAVKRCAPWRDSRSFDVVLEGAREAGSLRADGAALTSAVHNLIENAIKYSGAGQTICVRATRGETLVVEVADEGPGIAPEDRLHLFEPFFRGTSARGGSAPGNGLGLGVARDIARAHGGELELRTARGPGTTFALTLPLEADGGRA